MSAPKLAALAVVVRAGHVLLVQRKNPPDAGLWGFPGGHVEWGETALAAAARELAEETSVIATPQRYLTNVDVLVRDESGALEHHFLLAAVLCAYQSGTPSAGDDALDAAWVDLEAIARGDIALSARVPELAAMAAMAAQAPHF